jgi:hypothetical protein
VFLLPTIQPPPPPHFQSGWRSQSLHWRHFFNRFLRNSDNDCLKIQSRSGGRKDLAPVMLSWSVSERRKKLSRTA